MRVKSCVLIVVILAMATGSWFGSQTPTRIGSPAVDETARLRAHFDSVDIELQRVDVSSLSATQRAARSRLTEWLRDYREAGLFPRNDRFPGRQVPFFRDSRGVLCAMAYLIARSGWEDLVDRVARTNNNAFIRDLAADQDLVDWLKRSGLTLDEAARIQPTYGGPGESGVRTSDVGLTLLGVTGALVASGFNIAKPSRTSGWLGLAAGGFAGAVGVARGFRNGEAAWSAISVGLGAGAALLSIRGFRAGAHRGEPAALDERPDERRPALSLAPTLVSVQGTPALGFNVHLRL